MPNTEISKAKFANQAVKQVVKEIVSEMVHEKEKEEKLFDYAIDCIKKIKDKKKTIQADGASQRAAAENIEQIDI